eukprot:6183397-Pleurochrysis_carterae.AAC.4
MLNNHHSRRNSRGHGYRCFRSIHVVCAFGSIQNGFKRHAKFIFEAATGTIAHILLYTTRLTPSVVLGWLMTTWLLVFGKQIMPRSLIRKWNNSFLAFPFTASCDDTESERARSASQRIICFTLQTLKVPSRKFSAASLVNFAPLLQCTKRLRPLTKVVKAYTNLKGAVRQKLVSQPHARSAVNINTCANCKGGCKQQTRLWGNEQKFPSRTCLLEGRDLKNRLALLGWKKPLK